MYQDNIYRVVICVVMIFGVKLYGQKQPDMSSAAGEARRSSAVVPTTSSVASTQAQQVVAAPQPPAPVPVNRTPVAMMPVTAQSPKSTIASSSLPSNPLIAPTAPSVFRSSGNAPESVKEEEPQGIDTVNNPDAQGNWLFKRMWWQRGQTQYEKVKAATDAIVESRMAFFSKRTEWDKTIFDPFYQESGLGRGVLEELIGSLVSQLSQERSHEGRLDEKERDLLSALESQKEALEQLQKDVQKINDIDNAVDEAITVLIKQINVARNFEKQSWQNFKAIAQELNDKKARDLYYGMVTYWQNINEIADYIKSPFLQHFDGLGAMAKNQTTKVLDALKALKEKGIDFKKQWQQMEENNIRQHQAQDFKEGLEEGKKESEAEKAAEQGFFAGVLNLIISTLSTSWDYIKAAGKSVWDFTIGRFFANKANETVEPASIAENLDKAVVPVVLSPDEAQTSMPPAPTSRVPQTEVIPAGEPS